MANEETPFTGGTQTTGKTVETLNIERLRFWGLSTVLFLLLLGKFITETFVVFPANDNPSSPWDKILGRAPSDFYEDQTFIFWLFKFNHTCSYIDFNPSRTITAYLMMFHIVPTDLFIILSYYRIKNENDAFNNLKIYAKYASALQFIFVTSFYMVFVNAPDNEPDAHDTQEGINTFKLHYIPYMCWQTGLFLMAIQQCWYISLKDRIPFDLSRNMLRLYLWSMGVALFLYTWFVWSFINSNPIWDTSTDFGNGCARAFMWIWNFYCLIIPAIFAWKEGAADDAPHIEIVFKNQIGKRMQSHLSPSRY